MEEYQNLRENLDMANVIKLKEDPFAMMSDDGEQCSFGVARGAISYLLKEKVCVVHNMCICQFISQEAVKHCHAVHAPRVLITLRNSSATIGVVVGCHAVSA